MINALSHHLLLEDMPDPATMQREPVRPLGALSDFVADELPFAIRAVQGAQLSPDALAEKAENIAQAAYDATDLSADEFNAKVGLLDCTVLENAVVTVGGFVRPRLMALTNAVAKCADSPPALTYESLIFRNPLADPRGFCVGHIGLAEALFYRAHIAIEQHVTECIRAMRGLLTTFDFSTRYGNGYQDATPRVIDRIDAELTPHAHSVHRRMTELQKELPLEAFQSLQPFFYEHPQRGHPGPSGKFSAGMLTLDAYACGDRADMSRFVEYKMRELPFYPGTSLSEDGFAGRADARTAVSFVEQHKTLSSLRRHHASMSLGRSVAAFFDTMRSMREAHVRLLMQFAPDTMRGAKGTGKELNVKKLVTTPIDIYRSASQDASSYFPITHF